MKDKRQSAQCRWCHHRVIGTCKIVEHLNQCSKSPDLSTVISICIDKNFTYGEIFNFISRHFQTLIIAECSGDDEKPYIEVLEKWPSTIEGVVQNGLAHEWVVFIFNNGVWMVQSYEIEPDRIKVWQTFLNSEQLPQLS